MDNAFLYMKISKIYIKVIRKNKIKNIIQLTNLLNLYFFKNI